MISKAHAKRKQDIKTKLMAAIAMLLVSSIMMVSSTYAWFTLSTAPEVTGINTAVGANGNLEMALLPVSGFVGDITTGVGDSTLATEAKNVTWGNLVDLSDSSVYGLDKITLYPSALNVVDGILQAAMLQTPTYGADGRVDTLTGNTSTGTYDGTEGAFNPDNKFGVRAVGVSSGMTDRQLDYRNARSSANTAMAQAKNLASQSLNTYGSALANIAIAHGIGGGTETYLEEDINALKAIVTSLNGEDGVLDKIETAYMQYILAYSASKEAGDDTAWLAVKAEVNAEDATLESVTQIFTDNNVTIPTELTTAISQYNSMVTKVSNASTALGNLTPDENGKYAWSGISGAMGYLVDVSAMKINDIPASEVSNRIGELAGSMGNGLTVTMSTNGGIYADIADQCGDFTASVTLGEIKYGGTTIPEGMTARMATVSTVTPPHLEKIGAAVTAAGAPDSGASDNLPISEMYGYVIDLAFRTNAAESKLLLQQEAVDRIYDENTNEETMGHGASMTFAATTTDFTNDQLRSLMDAIRIVFFNPDGNAVVAYAKLDAAAGTIGADGITAKIVLTDKAGNVKTAASEGDTSHLEIMSLTQNTAHALSVLVYLDGNNIGNDDVAATAATSMTGKMNLQFASSANLVPMEYANLHTPAGGSGTTETNEYTVTKSEFVVGNDKVTKDQNYQFTVVDGYTLTSVTIGGEAYTGYTNEGNSYTIPAADIDGNIEITVTETQTPAEGEGTT